MMTVAANAKLHGCTGVSLSTSVLVTNKIGGRDLNFYSIHYITKDNEGFWSLERTTKRQRTTQFFQFDRYTS